MATLSAADLTKLVDNLAAAYALAKTWLGDGTGSTSISAGAASTLAGILALDDYDQENDLLAASKAWAEQSKYRSGLSAYGNTVGLRSRQIIDALKTHENGDLDAALATEAVRVHADFDRLYYDVYGTHLTRDNVFPEVTITDSILQTAGLPVVSAGATIDEFQGPGQLEVEVITGAIGTPNWVLTLTCDLLDGTTEDKIVTVTGLSTVGTKFDVGTAADVYMGISAASATGGTNGDNVQVQTKLLRTPALIWA